MKRFIEHLIAPEPLCCDVCFATDIDDPNSIAVMWIDTETSLTLCDTCKKREENLLIKK